MITFAAHFLRGQSLLNELPYAERHRIVAKDGAVVMPVAKGGRDFEDNHTPGSSLIILRL